MPAIHEIRARSSFDQTWCEFMENTTWIAVQEDQDALSGLLDALFGVNATVLSVTAVEAA